MLAIAVALQLASIIALVIFARRKPTVDLSPLIARLESAERLQGTLERRLGESFSLVSAQLEQVHKGLGEMQTLAAGVGDLKKVLSNVKVRGT